MNPMILIGWLFLLASWFPKPFIKDEKIRRGINISLSAIATGIFFSSLLIILIK